MQRFDERLRELDWSGRSISYKPKSGHESLPFPDAHYEKYKLLNK